ncbi:S26 family signal peptidase [Desulfovibrio desulfuricans]|uniref:S26 family signal peptidase n=1 Tax=Desulfovibrio desulfuricans TaxID=876 RepID=UPI001AE3441A|nr:S26 family signal peptidase [Desulfovibrio desulfuricans]QTO39079.1 hypothetical protein J8J02_07885 [Desulfovibrio desulfuricans]
MKFTAIVSPLASLVLPGSGQILSGFFTHGVIFFVLWLASAQTLVALGSSLDADGRHATYFVALACEVLLRLGSAIDVVLRQRSQARSQNACQRRMISRGFVFSVLVLALVALPALEPAIKAYSMNGNRTLLPLITPDSRLLVDKQAYQSAKPEKGDIIVISTRHIAERKGGGPHIISRVAGIAGERVRVPVPAGQQNPGWEGQGYRECLVGEGNIYLSSINPASQMAFFAPFTSVVGRAEYIYWPPSQAGRIAGVSGIAD